MNGNACTKAKEERNFKSPVKVENCNGFHMCSKGEAHGQLYMLAVELTYHGQNQKRMNHELSYKVLKLLTELFHFK